MLFTLALPEAALAQAGKKRARILFRQGHRLAERGMHLDALRKFKAAKALYPSSKIDLNIGGILDNLGRSAEAAFYFERFLIQPPEESSDPRVTEKLKKAAKALLDEMKATPGSLKGASLRPHPGGALFAVGGDF